VLHPDGRSGSYTVVEMSSAAGIVALGAGERVWLVGRYRYPTDRESWQVVTVYSAAREAPEVAAPRHLLEETGLTATWWTSLGSRQIWNSVANHVGYLFLAQNLLRGESAG